MGLWPWEWAREALELVPELQFLRDWHVTQAGILAASAMGAKIDKQAHELMHPAAVPESMRTARGWKASFLDSAAAETDLRLAVRCGYVSQHVFDCLTTG
ncbi:hypothetical protein RDMS_01545 [Deinococcus sp. RL]|nr:hypothetical protein RDMS_01545 [Deinococcus sp. RL]